MTFRSLISVVVGLGLLVACFVGIYTDFRYAASGSPAEGFVSRTWETSSKSGMVTHCAYRYKVEGRWYEGTDTGHRTGDRVDVVYLRTDPAVSRLATTHAAFPLGLLEFVLGSLSVFIGVTRRR